MEALEYTRTGPVPLNAADLNRIESWTAYLGNYLTSVGYPMYLSVRTWTQADIPWQKEIDRIRKNICKLYAGYHSFPEWREITITNSLDFEQVNAMEWDLQMIYIWLSRMVSIFWHCGMFYLSEGGMT